MNVDILYEDAALLAINKPSGLLVHPIPGNQGETLIDWLRERYDGFERQTWPDATRPGIVHRLDRDTSGVMLIAKTPTILEKLQAQFAERQIEKVYLALCAGIPSWQTITVRAPVSRADGIKRKAGYLKLPGDQAKDAETEFRLRSAIKDREAEFSLIEARPKTGRTHQIRVHLGLEGYPILGDPWYQTKHSRDLAQVLTIPRLMLHAQKITFLHPLTSDPQTIEAPLPTDFEAVRLSTEKGGAA